MIPQMIGIQFYENDPRTTLEQKINGAQELHRKKAGLDAKICLVSVKNAEGVDFPKLSKACGLIVKPTRLLPIHHLWLGEEKEMQDDRTNIA